MQVSRPMHRFLSPAGRLAPTPFALGAVVVYVLSFLSQILISPPLLSATGLGLFALVQGLLAWSWFCLHARRLRDSGRAIAPATGIAIVYGLAMVLLLMLIVLVVAEPAAYQSVGAKGVPLKDLLIPFFLLAVLSSDSGLFAYVMVAILVLSLLPMLIAVGFSLWAWSRPTMSCPAP